MSAARNWALRVYTVWPAVNVDSQGNMAIGFSAAGPNLYAGAYYAVRAPSDPAGTSRTPGTLAAGLDAYVLPMVGRQSLGRLHRAWRWIRPMA